MKKIFGFTLAEVLITLGIIGVVAALTMPSLIANYQKKQASTAVKKVYSELSQALKLAELDYGPLEDWSLVQSGTLESNRTFVNTYISPYYKGLQIVSEGYDSNWGDNKGVGNSGINTITSNGSILSFAQTQKNIYILVDINGYKKPNIFGRDIFYFNTVTGKLMPSGWQDGLTRDMILSGYTSENGLTFSCKKIKNSEDDDYTDYRHGCTALLMIDGWEFKNDYPW